MECVRRSSHEGPLHYLQLVSQLVLTDVVNCNYPTEIYLEVIAPKFENLKMMVSMISRFRRYKILFISTTYTINQHPCKSNIHCRQMP